MTASQGKSSPQMFLCGGTEQSCPAVAQEPKDDFLFLNMSFPFRTVGLAPPVCGIPV